MFPGKRHLFIAVAICACLHVASVRTRRIVPLMPEVAVALDGAFQPDGQYPGEEFAPARGVRMWGSWGGSDDNVGSITIGPFSAPRLLRFAIGGYPGHEGNRLRVEWADGTKSVDVASGPVGERWHVVDVALPADWVGRAIRIVGGDRAKGIGGWFAITEPIRGGRGDGNNALLESLAAFAINGLLLGIVYCAAARQLGRGAGGRPNPAAEGQLDPAIRERTEPPGALAPGWIPLAAGAIVALCGYLAFWAYFANALFGTVFVWGVLGFTLITCLRPQPGQPTAASREVATVLPLMLGIGAFHLAVLHLFPTQHDFYTLAANRFREAMPNDNVLPHTTAQRLFASESLKHRQDEWLSSDRPPLQAGWQLITAPASKALGLERRTASGTSAMWFQLLWIAAAYGLLRSFAVERRRAAGWIAALGLCGFFLQNTTYTWPKLAAGAFAIGTFGVLLFPRGGSSRTRTMWAAGFAALAWLAHGGVAFSLLALIPFAGWRTRRATWRAWAAGAAVLLLLVTPWLAYQKLYDPPGNRLFKWHLAGDGGVDGRGTWETIRASYAKIGWRDAWSNKVSNFHGQVFGDWHDLIDLSADTAGNRRSHEFFHTARALTWWPILALFALVIARRARFTPPRDFLVFGGWLLLTMVLWCLLMFGKYQAVIHHGSYALMIGLFVFCSILLERSGRAWLPGIALLQAMTFATTWAVGNPTIHGPTTGLWFVIVTAAGLGAFIGRAVLTRDSPAAGTSTISPEATEESGVRRPALRSWWANPRLNLWLLAGLAWLLFLRKPHALHTPQLWAEDGSIFLMQADLHGASALAIPYMGYLHTLPRLIASLAPRLLDPAWWPAFYNGISFAIWLAVLARLFTSRFNLPGKPWLAFALIAVPHTGEVFFNITNLQWLTAFVLIQQVIIARPRNTGERVSDLLILALVTLTGPFGIAFLPLFIWRWWRDRSGDNAAALGVVVAGAALQAWFVVRTGPHFPFQDQPLNLWTNVVVLARRLVVWPAFGRDAALGMSPALVAAVGATFLAALFVWVLRPHPRRGIRMQVLAALALITLAAIYRTRPDTWTSDNLEYGDRYFYIPRVLLAWLLIWEFDAGPRIVANAARVVCLLVFLMHVRDYTVRAPTDYDWASHVEPIRQGIRADLPTLPEGWTLEYRGRPKHEE